jgi:hypothetical protein
VRNLSSFALSIPIGNVMGNTAELKIRLENLERDFDESRLNPTAIYYSVVAFGFLAVLAVEAYFLSALFGTR